MKNSKLVTLPIIFILVVSMLLIGCSNESTSSNSNSRDKNEEKVVLKLMRPGTVDVVRDIFEPMVADFEKQNPNIDVEIVDLGWGEYDQRLATMIATKTNPDVQLVSQGYLFSYASKGAYLPLDDFIDDELKGQITDTLWEAGRYNEKIYEVPATPGADMIWYNKELFKKAGLDPNKPPQTWDELIEYAQQITDKTGVPGLGMAGKAFSDIWNTFATIYQSKSGKPLYDEKSQTFNFDDSVGEESLQLMVDIVNDLKITQPNITEYTRGDLRTLFRDGQVGMLIDAPFIISALKTSIDIDSPDTFVGTAVVPTEENGSQPFFGADGWAISSNTKHPEEAWKLLRFLVNTENQYTHGVKYGFGPAQKDVAAKPDYQKPYWQTAVKSLDTGFSRMKSENFISLDKILVEMVQAAITGNATPKEAIDKAVEANKSLK
jgi:multiple sugar transport system substrate-binding protein